MVAPLVIAALTPFVKDLFANGLSLLGNAVLAKGKEKVEETLGVKLPPEGQPLSQEKLAEMRQLEFTHEEKLLELGIKKQELELESEKSATEAVTKRWEADMLSDSWLSKNIRPLSLIAAFALFLIFSVLSLFNLNVHNDYLTLLGDLLKIMVGAYFVGRTFEKSVDVYQGWKQTQGN